MTDQFQGDNVDSDWIGYIDDSDWQSAGRLFLQAKRDSADSGRTPVQQQKARGVMLDVAARWPGISAKVATATGQELGIIGDRGLRAHHAAERAATGLTRQHAHGGHKSPSGGLHGLADQYDTVAAFGRLVVRVLRIVLWPWLQLCEWLWARRNPHSEPPVVPDDPDLREIPF